MLQSLLSVGQMNAKHEHKKSQVHTTTSTWANLKFRCKPSTFWGFN